MIEHPPTPLEFPQSREETLAAPDEVLSGMMGCCDVEPADPDACNMCLAYIELQRREDANKPQLVDPLEQAKKDIRYLVSQVYAEFPHPATAAKLQEIESRWR